jgi:hypothetical protein
MQCEAYGYRFSVAKIVKLSETTKCFRGKCGEREQKKGRRPSLSHDKEGLLFPSGRG